jgi:hypothetical protein
MSTKKIKKHKLLAGEMHNILFCIGGPLNDNKLNYSKEQLKTFWMIANIIKNYE